MKTLQELLQMKVKAENFKGEEVEMSPDFRVAVQGVYDYGVHIIVHPINHNQSPFDLPIEEKYNSAKREIEDEFCLVDYWYDHGGIIDSEA